MAEFQCPCGSSTFQFATFPIKSRHDIQIIQCSKCLRLIGIAPESTYLPMGNSFEAIENRLDKIENDIKEISTLLRDIRIVMLPDV